MLQLCDTAVLRAVSDSSQRFIRFMDDIVIILILILLNGVFSMSEIALISARKSRLASDAKNGSRGARAALKLAEEPDRFLSTIQIGITLIGILTGLYSGAALAEDVGRMLQNWGMAPRTAHNVGQTAIVAVVTYLSIVAGELVPKRIGLAVANPVARAIARPMHLLSVIAMPAVWLLSASTSLIVKIIGLKSDSSGVTEDEIKSLIKDGTDAGEVRKVEQNIMERALVLGDLRVSAIMTPKPDITALRLDMTAAEVKERIAGELHNTYPVYCDSSMKSVCGVVSLKQLILTIGSPDFVLADVVSQPEYFPETMNVYDALDRMKNRSVHFALVCDEFGEMTGVMTPGDILDGLVGAMPQQTVMPPVTPAGRDNEWSVDAPMQFYDFLSHFGLEEFYIPSHYSTLGGFMLEELRHVPAPGETVKWNGICFRVISVDGARIERVLVTLPPSPPTA